LTYDAETNRPDTVVTNSGSTPIQNLTYHYFDNGNIRRIEGASPQTDQQFTYNGLNRLTGATLRQQASPPRRSIWSIPRLEI